ncbi:C-type natriuretic peptide 2-like [Odontesthes bonariensis]|uniref:C-type natriuretic peptide 2-like n=1 Tax=Odontesthes bonariensis TaxID=219752 RepID=UPI003F5886BD
MAASSSFLLPVLLLLFLTVTVETRSSHPRDDRQVFGSLFGSRIAALILDPPPSDDITEGSAGRPAFPSLSDDEASGPVGRRAEVPRFFVDFLRRQAKTRRRSRKSMVGGRGCFGMKMDRIGSISGLGC